MTSAMYQDTGSPLLLGVATPQQDRVEDEETVMDSSTEHDWTELQVAVAEALGLDPKDVAPHR